MKTLNYLLFAVLIGTALFLQSCKKEEEPKQNYPPNANFSIQNGSAVVNESFKFISTSSGDISSYFWDFGAEEGSSSAENPSYRFKKLGTKTVSLRVNGPGGSDTYTKSITVYAMPQDCHNYNSHYNMNSGTIWNLRNQGNLDYGRLMIFNDYGSEVKIEIYHPDNWLDEKYYPWGNRYWNVPYNLPDGNTLITSGGYFNIGGDWGIRVTFGNGVKSCIRTIHYYSKSFVNNGSNYLKVYASDIYENNYSWNKTDSRDKPCNVGSNILSSEN